MNVVTGIRHPRWLWAWICAIAVASTVPYWRSLGLPPIEDDYIQVWLGRHYGPPERWGDLASDALYRCRATSILLTWATEQIFGNSQTVFNLQSLVLHAFNVCLVAALGRWRRIGFALSLPAAFFWGLAQRHHEAVIWYAALPEQLVFLFTLAAFLAWIEWWQSGLRWAYWLSLAFFILGLLSKESAVVFCGLALLPLIFEPARWRPAILAIAPAVALSFVYFLANYFSKSDHLHWNDGTFRLGWHFGLVLVNSVGRMFWVWGIVGLSLLYYLRKQVDWPLVAFGLAWILISLAPYSFVDYMPRVPSRHVYLAGVGRALMLAAAFGLLWKHRRTMATVACLYLVWNVAYVWLYKHDQFAARAQVTEDVVDQARGLNAASYRIECFPHAPELAVLAISQRLNVDEKKVSASRSGNCVSLSVLPVESRVID